MAHPPPALTLADDDELPTATPPGDALALRRPDTPATLDQLAALKVDAREVIDARIQILTTLRKAAIRATSPEDWLLFRSPDGRVIGFLQDAGCDRIRDLFGISILNVSHPERIASADPSVFHYLITGDGYCAMTKQRIESMEGGRSSTDDFCKGKSGAELELLVRKAARANLDGGLTRELAGMKSVPIDELTAAWAGSTKKVEHCRQGRGFGSQAERRGATVKDAREPAIEKPFCEVCGATATYHAAGTTKQGKAYDAFWGCPKRDTHPDQKWALPDATWRETLATQPTSRDPGQDG